MQCARHPKVDTGLTCGRCETPICPRCAVFTDVGARCPSCAPARKLPQFEIGPVYLMRAAAAALVASVGLGAVWGALLPGRIGIFGLLMAALIGYLIAGAVSVATNHKSGTPLQVLAAAGAITAYLVHNLVIGTDILPSGDLFGYVAVIIAGAVAINRLRY
ncbi:MAG: hypothetical protein IIA91_10570 [Chloroflexi bacterium]|nr:hypothetical protein [Chloroflexota bacterium]